MYFLSDRDFNEVLGNVDFEFSNPKTTRIYVVTLRKDEASPFLPLSDETQIKKEEKKDELLTPPGNNGQAPSKKARAKKKERRPPGKLKDSDKKDNDKDRDKDKEKDKEKDKPKEFRIDLDGIAAPHRSSAHRARRSSILIWLPKASSTIPPRPSRACPAPSPANPPRSTSTI